MYQHGLARDDQGFGKSIWLISLKLVGTTLIKLIKLKRGILECNQENQIDVTPISFNCFINDGWRYLGDTTCSLSFISLC